MRGRLVWLGAAVALFAAGALVSGFVASAASRSNAQRAHQAFVTTSTAISSRLELAIQQEDSLVVSAQAFIAADPTISNTQFLSWVRSMKIAERYPEVRELAFVAVVRPQQLSQFLATLRADPPQAWPASQTYQITPAPGTRPFYCLVQLMYSHGGPLVPLGLDSCAGTTPSAEDATFAHGALVPYTLGKTNFLAVAEPVYPGGVVPSTAQARTDRVFGLVGLVTAPSFVLRQALVGHPGTAVAFHYQAGSQQVTYTAGSAPARSVSYTTNLHNGWRVQTFAAVTGPGIGSAGGSLLLLVGGIVVSALLGTLFYLLGTGRSRAMVLVRQRTSELHHLALHDALTGLPNRALILDRLEQALARSRRDHTPVAVLFLDLDNFKDVNDTLGHAAGDELLVAVTSRLTGAIREKDTVGRLGGDEFVVVADGDSLAAGAEMVADRILDVLATPFEIDASDVPLFVTASIGIAEDFETTPDELLRDADIALYEAKAAGKRRAVTFAPSMQRSVDDHRTLELDLQMAFEAGEFFLLYQPVVDLASGAFTGVEALLRWNHPTRGVVLPDLFIPALEASGMIVPVGRWVLEEACRQGATWQRQGHHLNVSINLSAKQLEDDLIIDDVHGALEASGFDADRCVLELTESTLMHDMDGMVVRLTLLKALGVRLAVDDFGTGYSSLAYLQQFPIDVLKIDRSFVAGVADTGQAAALVHSMVQLGIALNLETVAEGVETSDQRRQLASENIGTAQGFLFAHPLEPEAVDRLLAASANSEPLHSSLG